MDRETLPYDINTTPAQTIFWAKGSTWSDLDAQIVAEIKKNTCNWPRDRFGRTRKAFMTEGALGATAAMDQGSLSSFFLGID